MSADAILILVMGGAGLGLILAGGLAAIAGLVSALFSRRRK